MKKFLFYFLFVVNLVIICVFWWIISGFKLLNGLSFDILFIILARLAGLLSVYFILIQFLIIGRVKWLEREFGFDKLTIAHRWFGGLGFGFILLHFTFLLLGYGALYEVSLWQQFIDFNFKWEELFSSTVAMILFSIIIVSSISIARKRLRYELWYYIHIISYLAVILAFGHQLEIGFDLQTSNLFGFYWILLYLFVGINFVFYRFLWQLVLFQKQLFYVSEIKKETENTVSVYIKGNDIGSFDYKNGQFVILRFLSKDLFWQTHPYSISSVKNNEFIRVTIKSLGDFSSQVANIKVGTKIIIDGPNGVFTKKVKQGDKILLIAGGVGITPVRALAEDFLENGKKVILLYSIRNSSQIIFREELENLVAKYSKTFIIHYIISEKNAEGFSVIDKKCINNFVLDVAEYEAYLCGPTKMTLAMKKYLTSLKINKGKIYYEKFSF